MQIRHLFTIALTVFAISAIGCGQSDAAKDQNTQTEVNEGNDRIASVNTLINDLNDDYHVNVNPAYDDGSLASRARDFDWSRFSSSDLSIIHGKLADVVGHINRVLEISGHQGVTLTGGGTSLLSVQSNAQNYLDSINLYLAQNH